MYPKYRVNVPSSFGCQPSNEGATDWPRSWRSVGRGAVCGGVWAMVADAATNRGRTSSEQTAPRGRSPPIVSSPVDPLSVRRQRIEPDLPSLVWEGLRLLAPVHIPRRRARPGLRRALLNRNFRVGPSRVGVKVRPHIPGCKKDLQGKRLDSRGLFDVSCCRAPSMPFSKRTLLAAAS